MLVYVDIDETICSQQGGDPRVPKDYSKSLPLKNNINKVNDLYDQGHTIVYWTARGSMTGIDWTELTTKQLDEWGCKYHEVKLGKPHYDIFIDDKSFNTRVFEQISNLDTLVEMGKIK